MNLSSLLPIAGKGPGGNASRVLTQAKLKILVGAGHLNVKSAYLDFKKVNFVKPDEDHHCLR